MHCTDNTFRARAKGARWVALMALCVSLSSCDSLPLLPSGATSAGSPTSASSKSAKSHKSWADFKVYAAQRIVEANPNGVYSGTVPQVLLAIPVLEMELNADGSIRRIEVMRRPGQAPETLQMAIDAVKRAAPFGDVSALPKPWKFSEVFLFNDERRFKPRTLDVR